MNTIDCRWLAIEGKAPTEAEVDKMIKALDEYAKHRGYVKQIAERQYWDIIHYNNDCAFLIFRDYE